MSKATKTMQLNFMMKPDRPGLLAEVTTALANSGVNITAMCAYGMEGEATFSLITDDNGKAKTALAAAGLEVQEVPVASVDMPNQPGELQKVAKKLADAGINILYLYGSAGAREPAVIIFATSDTDKTIEVINA